MRLEGSCHCGKVRFTVESAEPVQTIDGSEINIAPERVPAASSGKKKAVTKL